LGVRVPAIVVSPFTPPQTIVNRCFEHTSVLSTVVNRFTLAANQLGARQKISPDVSDALKLSAPRDDRPPIPRPTTVTLGFLARIRLVLQSLFRLRSKQLTGLQRDIVRAAAHRLEGIAATSGLTGFTDHRMEADAALSVIDAEKLLIKLEADLMLKKMG
jgi:phospholipase C